MKVLIYSNRKDEDEGVMYDISTPEKEAAAYLKLFHYLDEEWEVYGELSAKEKPLYAKAKAGDSAAAKKLLTARNGYEYEGFVSGKFSTLWQRTAKRRDRRRHDVGRLYSRLWGLWKTLPRSRRPRAPVPRLCG
jgi:hypothetical protein